MSQLRCFCGIEWEDLEAYNFCRARLNARGVPVVVIEAAQGNLPVSIGMVRRRACWPARRGCRGWQTCFQHGGGCNGRGNGVYAQLG